MPRGFTLFETVLVIGLLAIIFLVGFQAETVIQSVMSAHGARQIESILGTAAQRARNGVQGTNWGVYFDYNETTRVATQAILFSGSTFASRDMVHDVVFTLGRDLRFSNVSLSGSVPSAGNDHEINFVFMSGATTQYGSITIVNLVSTTQIDISATGIAVRH